MSDKAKAGDKVECQVLSPPGDGAVVRGHFDMACWEKGPDGQPRQVWAARAQNGVVREGLGMLLNIGMAGQRVSTDGPFLVLHGASFNSTQGWAQLSGSQVSGYSANWLRATGFSSTNATAGSLSFSQSYVFSIAGTQTVSGAALVLYTATSAVTNPTAGDVKLYNIGTFTAAQAVQSNNTLNVTANIYLSTG